MNNNYRLFPIWTPENSEFFTPIDVYPPSEICYGKDDPLNRVSEPGSHATSYLGTILRFNLLKLCLGDKAHSGVSISLGTLAVQDMLFVARRGEKRQVLELKGLYGNGTEHGYAKPEDTYNTRRINLAFRRMSVKLLREHAGHPHEIFNLEEGHTFDIIFDAKFDKDTNEFNIADFQVGCSDKTVELELVGFKLNTKYLVTPAIA